MSTPLWEPDAARCATSNLARFMDVLGPRAGRMLSTCDDLHRFSVNELESFWGELWDFSFASFLKNKEALANPEALELFRELEGLRY